VNKLVIIAGLLSLLTGCVYLPRCTEVQYKSVVTKDDGKVRDILTETGSPLGGDNSLGYAK